MHRFLWRDFINIGDKLAGCITQLAMCETANLPSFAHLEGAPSRQLCWRHSHITQWPSPPEVHCGKCGADLKSRISSQAMGFLRSKWEGWVRGREEKIRILPNQIRDDDNKALGLGYDVKEDKLCVMTINQSQRERRKWDLVRRFLQEQVRAQTPNPLTQREWSQVSDVYDPVGLVTPTKQKGTILVRRAFQEAKAGSSQWNLGHHPLGWSQRRCNQALWSGSSLARLNSVEL